MKKKVVFLGFCLLWAHGAGAESFHDLSHEKIHQKQVSNKNLSYEDPPRLTHKSIVVKPQTVYLEDLNTPEKTKPKTTSALSPPTTGSDAGKIKTEPLPHAFTKQTNPPSSMTTPAFPNAAKNQNHPPEYPKKPSSFQGQYAPFATETSRQQAAHSLVTQAKNENRSYPAGLDAFVIEFDQMFGVLSPNLAIRDLYKTDALSAPTVVKATKIPTLQSAAAPPATNVLILDDTPVVSTENRDLSPNTAAPANKKTQNNFSQSKPTLPSMPQHQQAKNKNQSHPAGLDSFVIEFDQTFGVLDPKPAIRNLYKTHSRPAGTVVKAKKIPEIQTTQKPKPSPRNTLILDNTPVVSGVDQGWGHKIASPLTTGASPKSTTVNIISGGTLTGALKKTFQQMGIPASETLIANTIRDLEKQDVNVNLVRAGERVSTQGHTLTFRGKTVAITLPLKNLSPAVQAKSGDTLIGLVKQAYPQTGQTAMLSETKILNWLTPLQDQGLNINTIPVGTKVAFNLDTDMPVVMIGWRSYQSMHGQKAPLADRE
jgi:hypothetical protein